ncbi:MAG: transposase zinc-binding domain-containing protein [Deltaproteobacteria bacterium]|nr:transposase zinc-binding domain-containing protein [Deltaproteobacteria bacterium]
MAFSCKHRGVCSNCGGRRMSETAARQCDRGLPAVPYRQWVLSLPTRRGGWR